MKNVKKLSNLMNFNIESISYKGINLKSSFYLKSLQLKQDFSKFKTHYRLAHPKYWDMERERTFYQKYKRDYKKPEFRGVDPLFFEDCLTFVNAGITLEQTLDDIRNLYPITSENKSMYGQFKCITLMYHLAKNNIIEYIDVFFKLESIVNFKDEDMEMLNGRYIYGYLYSVFKIGKATTENMEIINEYMDFNFCKMRAEWVLDLLEMAHENKFANEEYREFLMESSVSRLSDSYKQEFKYRQFAIVRLAKLLLDGNYISNEFHPLYEMLMTYIKERKNPLAEFQEIILLNLFKNYYSNPKSFRYNSKSLLEVLDTLKESFNKSHNLKYLYDNNTFQKLTLNELISKRNSINENNHFIEIMRDDNEEIIQVDENIEETIVFKKEDIVSFMEELHKKEFDFPTILFSLKTKYPDEDEEKLEKLHAEFVKKVQKQNLESLVKDGKFEKLFEKKSIKKVLEMKPPASDKKDAGGKGAAGGKSDAGAKGKGKK